MLLSSNAMAL
uniref:Uncharacterized protein n=1 Tax=Moniliophthora roreri TaxID=221103 RepID=A0A0W0F793_MONRR